MKIPSKFQPDLCASKDTYRSSLNKLHLQNGKIIASDGRRMVSIPVEMNGDDTNGLITIEAFKAARKSTKKKKKGYPSETTIQTSAKKLKFMSEFGEIEIDRPQEEKPVKFNDVIPAQIGKKTIGINIELLYGIGKALGSEVVRLSFEDEQNAIVVTVPDSHKGNLFRDGAFGILMPVRMV